MDYWPVIVAIALGVPSGLLYAWLCWKIMKAERKLYLRLHGNKVADLSNSALGRLSD